MDKSYNLETDLSLLITLVTIIFCMLKITSEHKIFEKLDPLFKEMWPANTLHLPMCFLLKTEQESKLLLNSIRILCATCPRNCDNEVYI